MFRYRRVRGCGTFTRLYARKMNRDERGVSVLEVIAVLMIFTMIAAILYSFLLMGTTLYKRITSETLLRNQANAVFASIINELRDSVYVQQGANDKEIHIVKWSGSADRYIEEHTYTFIGEKDVDGASGTPSEREVLRIKTADDAANRRIRTYGVTDEQFTMQGSFDVVNQESLIVTLEFSSIHKHLTHRAEEVEITIKQQIPLFRMK